MSEKLGKVVSAWQHVAKRSLAQWKMLSTVVLGVVLASAIMSGTIIYYDALREVALRETLSGHTQTDLDIVVKAERGPTNADEYRLVSDAVGDEVDRQVGWLLRDRIRGGKSPTFFLTTPGNEEQAGKDDSRTYFAFVPRLEELSTILPEGRLPRDHHRNHR